MHGKQSVVYKIDMALMGMDSYDQTEHYVLVAKLCESLGSVAKVHVFSLCNTASIEVNAVICFYYSLPIITI